PPGRRAPPPGPHLCHPGGEFGVAVRPDGRVPATTSDDRTVRLWDPRTGRQAGAPLTGPVNGVAFSPDGRLLATAGDDHTVRLWDPHTGRQVSAPLTAHTGPVNGAAFSADGRHQETTTHNA